MFIINKMFYDVVDSI